MTTILYDPAEKAIYSDSQETTNGTVFTLKSKKIKAMKLKSYGLCLVAEAGVSTDIDTLQEYLKGSIKKPDNELDCSLVILSSKGCLMYAYGDCLKVIKMPNDCYYNGTGGLIAKAVYSTTNCPIKAMKAAIDIDIYSGGNITKAYFYNGMPVFERVS